MYMIYPNNIADTKRYFKVELWCFILVLIFSFACSFASPPKEELKAPTQKEIITLMIKNLKYCQKWHFSEEKWNHFPGCRIHKA
jgi:hypothetical protein